MTTTTTMTSDGKRALARAIRGLRSRLITELGDATERAYRLSVADARKAQLGEAARARRARLEGWIDEQVRALPAKARAGAAQRLLGEVVKDAAATLLVRVVYLRLLEASGLSAPRVVTGGWDSRGYKDFREAAPELVRADETEGYAALLDLMWGELAHDLPGLYGPVRMTALVPVPAATLRAVVDALDDDELASVWTDDTTLGWIYQYWNDPEREALDAKLAASKKLENHEIASKTQMFTERYMVEWMLHNTLGQLWLAMCKRHGWVADAERLGVLDQLEARRVAWRARREAGEVAADALMPVDPGLEDRWKYWVPQPLPDDAVAAAPASVRELKVLDPACGSGHFLVITFELLFHLYQEEARHRGQHWSAREIVESILEHNLHGLDIDPRAVQIAAATLMLKARQLCPDPADRAEPRVVNLVAPALSLASLDPRDPALRELYAAVQAETGIPPELTAQIVAGLAGADHLGTLLRVDRAIDQAIEQYRAPLSKGVPDQGELFTGFGPRRRKAITAEHARAALLERLEGFLARHSGGADLGLRLRGEQLAAGVRFVRLVREGQYDLVIGNPPYQGTSKMADKAYVEKMYPRGKADLYAAFLERGLQLARPGGVSALLTMRSWMFIKQFSALREWLLATYDLRMLGDLSSGAFESIAPAQVVVTVCMSVVRRAPPTTSASIALRAFDETTVTLPNETLRKRAAVLAQVGRFEFEQRTLAQVQSKPVLYWWSSALLNQYANSNLIGEHAPVRKGIITGDDVRFNRFAWEVSPSSIHMTRCEDSFAVFIETWAPTIKGAKGRAWAEPLTDVIRWTSQGLELKAKHEHEHGSFTKRIQSAAHYFVPGVAFSMIGSEARARVHRFRSVFGNKGSSVFSDDLSFVVCAMNSSFAVGILQSLNPGIGFEVGDVERVPLVEVLEHRKISATVDRAFLSHESHREPSVEFRRPGPSPWRAAQAWAQLAVDRPDGAPLPPYTPKYDPEPPSDHLSFAVGVALGRFGAAGEGILTEAPAGALPHGILFLSDASDDDSLAHPAAAPIHAAWASHGAAIDDKRTLRSYLQDRFFSDVHRKMYENRPIYFPLSSAKRAFVAYVAIHRWGPGTLNDLLAEHLYPARKRLEGEVTDLRAARDGADKKASRAAEKRFGQVGAWLEELASFIAAVEQCAERGPPPPDGKTPARAADARYAPDLDDGVMINSAALWPLLEPQWKDPRKWWKELACADGKKDYDWSHLAARYFPDRVDAKCKVDPSLAVAHGCFWRYHPASAYQWELRLQDEIGPDFRLDELDRAASDAARAAFERDHAEQAEELVSKEHTRRARKKAKADGASTEDDDAPQASLDLADADEDDESGEAREPDA
ncbi:MAG: BREX-6 system adenine-specific DNA-methyltransferase PglX [Kofleriaceae bacterium]|nr:BREX-6 system adenine-specific DNA-methyltransferase PglX [Kofleriaceae bacterium]